VTPTEDGQALVIASETGIQVGPQIQVIQRTMFVVPFANLSGFIGAIEQARSEAQGKQSRIVIPQLG
jgi:hypothetical protein